jgi:K+-sensing histidine kinase KdpD
MKTLEFNANSWHYWLATKVASFDHDDSNFCAYVRSVLFGAFMISILAGFASAVLFAIGLEIRAFYTCFFTPVCTFGKNEQGIAIGFAILFAVIGLIGLMVWHRNRVERIRSEIYDGIRPEPQPGFISMAYKSIKEKTCFRVEFK